jgi:hypothetical protein
MSKLDNLTPEEQIAAVERYRKALGVKKPTSVDAIADTTKRLPAPETLFKFDHVLSQIFAPHVPWEFIPLWCPWTLYNEVQDRDDPFAWHLTAPRVKRHIRKWLWTHKADWTERSYTVGGRLWMHFPYGQRMTTSGWVRKRVIFVDSENTFPPRCGYNPPRSRRDARWLHRLNYQQVMDAYKKAGFTFI